MLNSFDYGLLNWGSLVLGLIAWMIPLFAIIRRKKSKTNSSIMTLLSTGACALALWFQISYINYLVEINDLPSLMDTIGTLTWVAAILLVVTFILNSISLTLNRTILSN